MHGRAPAVQTLTLLSYARTWKACWCDSTLGTSNARFRQPHTERELRKFWPDYKKPPNANDLNKRFFVDDLLRASRYDPHLERLLATVGLLPHRQRG